MGWIRIPSLSQRPRETGTGRWSQLVKRWSFLIQEDDASVVEYTRIQQLLGCLEGGCISNPRRPRLLQIPGRRCIATWEVRAYPLLRFLLPPLYNREVHLQAVTSHVWVCRLEPASSQKLHKNFEQDNDKHTIQRWQQFLAFDWDRNRGFGRTAWKRILTQLREDNSFWIN